MNLFKKLTYKNLSLNKKRTIVTIIGITLSVALVTAVCTMYVSLLSSLITFETKEKGDFHVSFYDVPINEVDDIKNNRQVEKVFLTSDIGYAKINSQNEYKPYALIKAFTSSSLENLSINLVSGRLPQNEKEIVIPTHLKTNGRLELKIGDSITLNVGTRISLTDNVILKQNNPFQNNEEIINTTPQTYKIVGIVNRPASSIESYEAPGYTFITYINENDIHSMVDVYAKYYQKNLKDYLKTTANILGVDETIYETYYAGAYHKDDWEKILKEISKAKYQISTNDYLISLQTDPINNSGIGGLGYVVVIVCLIIIISSVFCIKNSFDISITEKTKQYGMLKSIGATKKQIRKNVFFEASILGIFGIVLGLFFGLLAAFILVQVSNYYLKDMLNTDLKLIFSFSYIACLIAIILGIITLYFSAFKSARKASKISPIASIRNSNEIKIKRNKLHTPKFITKFFGIGGEISYKNMKRNKKKYRTTVISLIVSIFVFIALSTFINVAFISVKNEINNIEYNLDVTSTDPKSFPIMQTIPTLDNITDYSIISTNDVDVINPKYNPDYANLLNLDTSKNDRILLVTLGDYQYRKYLASLNLNYDDVKEKGILVDELKLRMQDANDKITNYVMRSFDYQKNEVINLSISDKRVDLPVAYVTNKQPFGLQNYTSEILIISDDYAKSLYENENLAIYLLSSNPNKLQDDIDLLLKDANYNTNNLEENYQMMKNLYTLIAIFLYGFIIVISLIGITNIFNTITTNMNLRKPEFAILKSIGMTSKEFQAMIRLESIFIGAKSLLFGVPIGLILSFLIHKILSSEGAKFPVPYLSIIICFVIVFLIINLIMNYSLNKIKKQNIIETIRNENI